MDDQISRAFEAFAAACSEFGMELTVALSEKRDELRIRQFLRCIPNDRIKEQDFPGFLEEVLGRTPSKEMIERVCIERRGAQLPEDEVVRLEEKQNSRCALCGSYLNAGAAPQVDHVVPVALGGKSRLDNYQILCRKCNQGKSKLLGWIMGAPFISHGDSVSAKLRYCVLARDGATCTADDCDQDSATSELHVVPVRPVGRGGRLIFDNLMSLCTEHRDSRESEIRRSAKLALNRRRLGGLAA